MIDDDPLVGQLIEMFVAAFREEPFTVDHVTEYEPGLRQLLTGNYALCLLDYRLGSGNGLQLLREAKAQRCVTPIILLTGDDREETDEAAMESGAADFINKRNLKPDALERSVGYAIKTAAAFNELRIKSGKASEPA